MMNELGAWLWILIDVVAVGVLGAAMAYGIVEWRHRRKDRAARAARNSATREVYRQENRSADC